MHRLAGRPQHYDWGSVTAIPDFLGEQQCERPVAELWFGAHPQAPSLADGDRLDEVIAKDPRRALGPSTCYAFGYQLPYLLKLIAPDAPLSLQLHPSRSQAQTGFLREETLGIPRNAPERTYRDPNHKPELLYALTHFRAFAGFSVRRKSRELLESLDAPLAQKINRRLLLSAGRGMRPVVTWLLDPDSGPTTAQVVRFGQACGERLRAGASPDPLLDEMVSDLHQQFPGDPAVAVAFLMNPVHLSPGEALYLPAGTLHSYQSGFAVEVMASSDNVIRAGLTSKHIDRGQLLDLGEFDAHPAVRLAPERPSEGILRFNPPVEDFELSVATVKDDSVALPSLGPRIVLCLDGNIRVECLQSTDSLKPGECVFISDGEGPARLSGNGHAIACSVP